MVAQLNLCRDSQVADQDGDHHRQRQTHHSRADPDTTQVYGLPSQSANDAPSGRVMM